MISQTVVQALAVTAEAMGQTLSEGALSMMAHDLGNYPEGQVLLALAKCRMECRGRLSLAEILDRVHGQDGRPGAEEAWALVPKDEQSTAVWTDEMAQAWGIAEPLLGDEVAARMAFRETYTRLVREAREKRAAVKWRVTLGHDVQGREEPVRQAVLLGRLSPERAIALVPQLGEDKPVISLRGLLAGKPPVPCLPEPTT